MALILIAEDAMFSRRLLCRILQEQDHETLEAKNGYECLEKIAEYSPDCLILDLLMPDMNGYEVLKELQKQGLTIPVIVVTADIQESSRQQCLNLGAIAVVNKPPKPDELMTILNSALAM